jgi:hypothetical protein
MVDNHGWRRCGDFLGQPDADKGNYIHEEKERRFMVSSKGIGSSACEAVGDTDLAELLGIIHNRDAEVVYIFHVKSITKICIYAGTS